MTLEELNQLKRGDEIFIRAKFVNVFDDGDVLFTHTNTHGEEEVIKAEEYTHPDNVILPPSEPKYDPCRLFKKGDVVEYSSRDGRDCLEAPWIYDAAEVVENEDKNGSVVVRFTFNCGEPAVYKVPWYYLQLVTPVEELEPYIVKKYHEFYAVERRNNHKDRPATYNIDFHPNAKAAAEAECDRLNAEHRKEQA